MARPEVLRRVLRLRELQEEQSRLMLEAAAAERMRMERVMESAVQLQVSGRRSFLSAVLAADGPGRVGGNFDQQQGGSLKEQIAPQLAAAEIKVGQQRAEFLSRRTERRQVVILIENEQALADTAIERRTQQILDDWYGRRAQKEMQRRDAVTRARSISKSTTESESATKGDSTSLL
ncbi:hypothetical protein [Acidicapsa ligni]|uniref:hypothetical protein n=1 Tax=Acidicapsa ligni TaxID=542300 RepID=UPI0021E07183|nr:hypothetical protein [Acidicapsa ligni]